MNEQKTGVEGGRGGKERINFLPHFPAPYFFALALSFVP